MGQVKRNCHQVPKQGSAYRLTGVHPDWEMHPDWINALESLDAYNLWVCEVVFPIAFQWVEEHKEEVYKNIPKNLSDDIGIVIAESFELVKKMRAYSDGMKERKKYEKALKSKSLNTSKINPVWQKLMRSLRLSRISAKNKFSKQLKSSLR